MLWGLERRRLWPRWRALIGLAACALACGGSEPGSPSPRSPARGEDDAPPPAPRDVGDPDAGEGAGSTEGPEQASSGAASEALPEGPEVELEATFHRTRVGPGKGFWVLAMVTNPGARAVTHARLKVQLLADDGTMLLEVVGTDLLALDAGAGAAGVVLVEAPVEHERLELSAVGVERSETSAGPTPSVELQHDPPLRAKLGGYFVLGQAHNAGGELVEGARIEVRAYDRSDLLLGVDWFALASLEPDETAPFDLGGLRYEEPPQRFELVVVP